MQRYHNEIPNRPNVQHFKRCENKGVPPLTRPSGTTGRVSRTAASELCRVRQGPLLAGGGGAISEGPGQVMSWGSQLKELHLNGAVMRSHSGVVLAPARGGHISFVTRAK